VGDQRHTPAALPTGKTRHQLYSRLSGSQGRSNGSELKTRPRRPRGWSQRTTIFVFTAGGGEIGLIKKVHVNKPTCKRSNQVTSQCLIKCNITTIYGVKEVPWFITSLALALGRGNCSAWISATASETEPGTHWPEGVGSRAGLGTTGSSLRKCSYRHKSNNFTKKKVILGRVCPPAGNRTPIPRSLISYPNHNTQVSHTFNYHQKEGRGLWPYATERDS